MLFHAYTLCLISFSLLSQVFVFFKIYFAVLIFSWAHFSIFTVSHLILLISSSLIYFPFSSCSHFCSFFLPSSLSNFFFLPSAPFSSSSWAFQPSSEAASQLCGLCLASDSYYNETHPNIPFSLYSSPPPPHLLPWLSCFPWYPTSPPTLPTLLPRSPSGSLDSVSSHFKRAQRDPRREDPGTRTSARGGMCCVVLQRPRGWGGHAVLRADVTGSWAAGWGDAAGKERHSEGPTPAALPGEGGETGDKPEFLQTLHLCSALLSSPCSSTSPPAPHFDSTFR